MARKSFIMACTTVFAFVSMATSGLAVDKIKFGTAIRETPVYYLPVLAAEEKGFWKQNRLEVEWVPFKTTATMHQSIAGGSINIGLDNTVALIPAIARGVPAMIVANLQTAEPAVLWVLAPSPVKEPAGLKGGKIGIISLGGAAHAYARLLTRLLGLEKEVKFVAAGGIVQNMAALKAGVIDAVVMMRFSMIPLEVKGEVRPLANLEDFVKGERTAHVVFARKDLVGGNPDLVKRVLRAIQQGIEFIKGDKDWAMEKMRLEQGLSPEAARQMYDITKFSSDGKMSAKALENVRNFLLEFGLVAKEKAPSLEELYTRQFTG